MSVVTMSTVSAEANYLDEHYQDLPSSTQEWRQNTTIYSYHQEARSVYLVTAGFVLLWRWSLDNDGDPKEMCIGIRGPGETFGALYGRAAYDEEARVLTNTATARVCRCDHIPNELLVWELQRQALDFREHLAIVGGGSSHMRVARLLCDLHYRRVFGSDNKIFLAQTVLAALASLTRESVVHALSDMRNDGLICTGTRSIHLLNLEELERRAGY